MTLPGARRSRGSYSDRRGGFRMRHSPRTGRFPGGPRMTIHDDLDAVLRPVADARGLPNAHYVSEEMFARERDAVLFSGWAGLTFGKEIPDPGDALPVDFLGMPLLAVRDREGRARVFQ